MKVRSVVGALLSLAVLAGPSLAHGVRQSTDAAPPLEKILANTQSPANVQLAELITVRPEVPLGPPDALKEYELGMALIAQGMSADVVNISRAQQENQITREQADYLIEEKYQIAMMQYQVLSALHDTLEHDVAQEAARAKHMREGGESSTAVVVEVPSSGFSPEAK